MTLHHGDRVYWGAPEVIYLEGTIIELDEAAQSAVVHIERATPHSAHLIGSKMVFSTDGLTSLTGDSPPGIISVRSAERLPPRSMSDEEKIHSAASVAVHQEYGYGLPAEQEQILIAQIEQALQSDPALRARIIASMDEILKRQF
jgi:hypothetical protein